MKAVKDELYAALERSRAALATFEAMPLSHQRRWLEHIGEAKRPATRARRIEKCVHELSQQQAPASSSAGYSGTPLLKKLGIKDGQRVALVDAPKELPVALVPFVRKGKRPFDVIVLFARERAGLERRFREAARNIDPAGGLWVAWPKRASGVATDLTEDRVRELALAAGLVDNKVCAIDDVWSGLRCVYRVKDRPARGK